MRTYQKQGARMIDRLDGRCLLADEMGLGKTWEVLAYLAMHPQHRPAIVICPASIKRKWEWEIKNLLPNDVPQVIMGHSPFDIEGSIVIINYDIIHYSVTVKNKKYDPLKKGSKKTIKIVNAREELLDTKFRIVIADEAHRLANSKTGRTKAFKKLCINKSKVIFVTGTPIEDGPINFYTMLSILKPDLFGNWMYYIRRYCNAKNNGFGWDYSGASNTTELYKKIKPFMIRRLKSEVEKELPDKTRIIVPLEMKNRSEYDKAETDFIQWVKTNVKNVSKTLRAQALTKMAILERIAIKEVLNEVILWIDDYLSNGDSLVVGVVHRDVNNKLYSKFKKTSVQIIGGMGDKKFEISQKFQNDPNINLAVCNMESAGEGLDLYKAPATLSVETMWNPAKQNQFEGRVHRIGQKANKVFAYCIVPIDSIIEDKLYALDRKQIKINAVVDGIETDEEELFTTMIDKTLERRS